MTSFLKKVLIFRMCYLPLSILLLNIGRIMFKIRLSAINLKTFIKSIKVSHLESTLIIQGQVDKKREVFLMRFNSKLIIIFKKQKFHSYVVQFVRLPLFYVVSPSQKIKTRSYSMPSPWKIHSTYVVIVWKNEI